MNKETSVRLALAAALSLAAVCAPAQGARKVMDVIDPVEDAAGFLPADAAKRPHILFVNVAGALPDGEFRKAAAYVRMKYGVRVAVRDEAEPFAGEAVARASSVTNRFGANAVLTVALVRKAGEPTYVAVPGWFAQVNVEGADRDSPNDLFRYKRACQFALRGLAYACGVGVNPDDMCVMSYRGFTLEGMDAVSATFGPYAYFPLRETLRMMAGDALFSVE